MEELDRGTLRQTSHPFENTDKSKNQLVALLIRTLIGLECVVLQTVAPYFINLFY